MSELTPKQAAFVREYLIDLNGTQAAIRAGYSAKTARAQANQMLAFPLVKAAVDEAIEARAQRTEITADRVLKELAKIGFADIRKAVIWQANVTAVVQDEDGNERLAISNQVQLIDSANLDDDTAAAVSAIGQDSKGGLSIKFHDKQAALTQIGRHLGMFKDKVEHEGELQFIIKTGVPRANRD